MSDKPWEQRGRLIAESVLDDDLCDALLSYFKNETAHPRSYQGIIDPTVRKCDYVRLSTDLTDQVNMCISDLIDRYFNMATLPITEQPHLIYRYGEGVGFATHHDEVTSVEQERARANGQPVIGGDITAVLFLNGPEHYDGGALYFEQPTYLELRLPRGSLVSFPATRSFPHGVYPITAGERYTLLARRKVATN